jgi:hypothetical protein
MLVNGRWELIWRLIKAGFSNEDSLHCQLKMYYKCHIFNIEVLQERIATHRTTIASHPNPLMAPLLHLPPTRRLKWRWTFDRTHWGGVVGHILRSPPNRTSPLAHRKWCTVNVFWLLITVLIKKNIYYLLQFLNWSHHISWNVLSKLSNFNITNYGEFLENN